MLEFGKTLRAAREAKGITISQIAEKTHMLVQIVEGLEKEDFTKIVAPIYGRGFVKLYCEAVGLDSRALVEEFMEIYSGNREPVIRERQNCEQPPAQPINLSTSVTTTETEIPVDLSTPAEEQPPVSIPTSSVPEAKTPQTQEFDFNSTPSRYVAPMPIDDEKPSFSLPKLNVNWRMVVLGLAGAITLYVLFAGIKALYRATMNEPATPIDTPSAETVTAKAPADRKALPVKPFYLD